MNIGCLIYIGAGICLLLVVAVVLVEAAYDDGFADGFAKGRAAARKEVTK